MTSVRPPRVQVYSRDTPLRRALRRSSPDPRLVINAVGTSETKPVLSSYARSPNAATDAASRVLLEQKFGPALGLTRLERWERADKLDLSPPADVLRILREVGDDDPEFRDCVWERIV